MPKKTSGQKGYDFEELLRSYFIESGFYALRGVPIKFHGEDATDIDLWLYERPTGTTRRIQIVDAKFKQKPKAVERIFWTRGVAELLGVDEALVATTGKGASLRQIARSLNMTLIDGGDLKRMADSPKIPLNDRLSEEQLIAIFKSVDRSRRNKELCDSHLELKSYVATSFGAESLNMALTLFSLVAANCVTSHKGSKAANANGRLAYFCASIAAASLDLLSVEEPFKAADDRRKLILNAVRYGSTNELLGTEKLRVALALIREYAENGVAIASKVEQGVVKGYEKIPAEIIADQFIGMSKNGELFNSARRLEQAAYSKECPSYDMLDSNLKSLLGAFLDFSDVDRAAFAQSWGDDLPIVATDEIAVVSGEEDSGPLFEAINTSDKKQI